MALMGDFFLLKFIEYEIFLDIFCTVLVPNRTEESNMDSLSERIITDGCKACLAKFLYSIYYSCAFGRQEKR